MRRHVFAATVLIGRNMLVREGIEKILRTAKFGRIVSVRDVGQIDWNEGSSVRLLFLIVHAGNDMDAVTEQIGQLRQRYPNSRVAMVADSYRLNEMVAAFRVGASGYFVDVIGPEVFMKSLELISMGETVFPPQFAQSVIGKHCPDGQAARENAAVVALHDPSMQQLSPREEAILQCLIAGESNKLIARKISIAEATVKAHIKAILRKIRVQNRTQAAIWALNSGGLRSARREPDGRLRVSGPEAGSSSSNPEIRDVDISA